MKMVTDKRRLFGWDWLVTPATCLDMKLFVNTHADALLMLEDQN